MDQAIIQLRDWQTLAGTCIGALALAFAVLSGFGAERRRRREQSVALHIALCAELRQMARHTLSVEEDVLKLLPPVNPNLVSPPRTVRDLQSAVRFPDAVVYTHAAAGLGALGEHAQELVNFYHQLWRVRDGISRLWISSNPELQMLSVASAQIFEVANSLLGAVDAALLVLAGVREARERSADQKFAGEVAMAKERLHELKMRYANRL